MSSKVNVIQALIQDLSLEEATEVLDMLLVQVIILRENEEQKPHLTPIGKEAKKKAEVVELGDYRKPPEPISLDDYRNRSKD